MSTTFAEQETRKTTTSTGTMRAAVFHGVNDIRVEEVPRAHAGTRVMTRSFNGLGVALLLAAVLMLLPSSQVRADAPSSAVFKAKCASCHGPDGTGSTPIGKKLNVRDLCLPDVQKQTDAELTKLISGGKGKMPAFATKLSADQIKALVVTIREMAAK